MSNEIEPAGEYRGFAIGISFVKNEAAEKTDWHCSVFLWQNPNEGSESFAVQPSDRSPSEARERAIRVAKMTIDKRLARQR